MGFSDRVLHAVIRKEPIKFAPLETFLEYCLQCHTDPGFWDMVLPGSRIAFRSVNLVSPKTVRCGDFCDVLTQTPLAKPNGSNRGPGLFRAR
jgi:hypothetical protein